MFAVLAIICFVLSLCGVVIGPVNLVTLGLVFLAAHLLAPDVIRFRNRV